MKWSYTLAKRISLSASLIHNRYNKYIYYNTIINYYYYLLSNIYKSIGSVTEQFMVQSVDIVEPLNLNRE